MGWDLGLERHRQQFGELLLMVKLQASPFFPSCDSCFMNRAVWKSQQQPIKHVSLVSPFRCQQASDIQCSCLLPTQKQLLLGMNFCSSELSRHRLAASGIKISTVIGFTVWRHVPEDRWVVLFLYRLCRSCHHTLRSCVGDSFGSAWDGRSWSHPSKSLPLIYCKELRLHPVSVPAFWCGSKSASEAVCCALTW